MMPRRLRPLRPLLLLALSLSLACGARARHATVVVDTALYEGLSDIHAAEQTALCGAPSCAGRPDTPIVGWSHDKSVAFNQKLLPAAEAGRQLNIRLAAWQPGQPVPQEVSQLIQGLSASLAEVVQQFPAGTSKEAILTKIAQVQQLALAVLNSVLMVAAAK